MSGINSKRKFLKPIEVAVAALLVVSTPVLANTLTSVEPANAVPTKQSIVYQNASSERDLLLIEPSNVKYSKVDHYSHSSHSSHSSHYSSSR